MISSGNRRAEFAQRRAEFAQRRDELAQGRAEFAYRRAELAGRPTALAALVGHDAEYHFVGDAHAVGTDGGEVVDAAVYAVVDDALGTGDALAIH